MTDNNYDLQDPEFGKLQAAQKELMAIDYDLRVQLIKRLNDTPELWQVAGMEKEIAQIAATLLTSRAAVLKDIRLHLRKAMMQSKAKFTFTGGRPITPSQPTSISRIILHTIEGWFRNYNKPTTMTDNDNTPTPPELLQELLEINKNLSSLGAFAHNGIPRKALEGLRTTLHITQSYIIDILNECGEPVPGTGINVRRIKQFNDVERKAQELKEAIAICQRKLINM